MQDMRGKVKRRLTGLAADSALVALHEAAAVAGPVSVVGPGGDNVGRVTSVHRTPGGALLLASISTAALEAKTELSVLGRPVQLAFA
jgi:folate-binding Fe-S cluster repair protein YgfZ